MVFPAEIIEIVRKAHTINSQLSIFNSQFLLGVSLINNHLSYSFFSNTRYKVIPPMPTGIHSREKGRQICPKKERGRWR